MNKRVIGVMKDELGGKIMLKFVALRPKTYSCLIDNGDSIKKAKGTKRCAIEIILKFKHYDCLSNIKSILQSQKGLKSEAHNLYTEGINKIALSSNDDKSLQTFDRTTTYSYDINAFKVCGSEILGKYK